VESFIVSTPHQVWTGHIAGMGQILVGIPEDSRPFRRSRVR
jgi:hypothetical protein